MLIVIIFLVISSIVNILLLILIYRSYKTLLQQQLSIDMLKAAIKKEKYYDSYSTQSKNK